MHIVPSELKHFVENNPKLVTRKQSGTYPHLYVLKYAREVFYKKLWNESPFLLECRGLVVDADYNVIIKPFTKVFNYGENGTTIKEDEFCTWVRKVNGFLGVVTCHPQYNQLIYSTTGSLDSEFCDLIEKHVAQYEEKIRELAGDKPLTLMFEVCDSVEDPHIVPEKDGAWLIGCDKNFRPSITEWLLDDMASKIGCLRPERGRDQFRDILQAANECEHEGFMVYGSESGTALKIKSPFYLVSKFMARMTPKQLANIGKDKQQAYERFDEEFYPLIDHISDNVESFGALTEQERLVFVKQFLRNK